MELSSGMIPVIAIGVGMGIGNAQFLPSSCMWSNGGGGKSVDLKLTSPFRWSNTSLKRAIREIESIQANMGFTSGADTQRFIHEARSGAMYGFSPAE